VAKIPHKHTQQCTGDNMAEFVPAETMEVVKKNCPEFYEAVANLQKEVFSGKKLDEKMQRLVLLAVVATLGDEKAVKRQTKKLLEMGATIEEIQDVMKVVYIGAGMPRFIKAVEAILEVAGDQC